MLPIFPLRIIEWPGNNVKLKVVEPAHRQLYDDLLAEGGRRLLAPLAPEAADTSDAPRVSTVAAVLYLEELEEVSAQSGGTVKYVAHHSVEGLAKINKLLNPSAFFKTNEQGAKLDYAYAEVELLRDPEAIGAGVVGLGGSAATVTRLSAATRLAEAWEDIRLVAERIDEPRMQSNRLIVDSVRRSPTWQLAQLWQRLQLSAQAHRERVRVTGEVKEWIEVLQQQGRLPRQLPPQVDVTKLGLPAPLLEAFVKSHSAGGMTLGDEFWEPLLEVLSSSSADSRSELLIRLAADELKVMQARSSLKELLG